RSVSDDADATRDDRAADDHGEELRGLSGSTGIHVRGAPQGDEAGDSVGDRAAVRGEGAGRLDVAPARKGEAHGEDGGAPAELEEGDREARSGRLDSDLRGLRSLERCRFVNSSP